MSHTDREERMYRSMEQLRSDFLRDVHAKWKSVPPTLSAPLDEVGVLHRFGRLITFAGNAMLKLHLVVVAQSALWVFRKKK